MHQRNCYRIHSSGVLIIFTLAIGSLQLQHVTYGAKLSNLKKFKSSNYASESSNASSSVAEENAGLDFLFEGDIKIREDSEEMLEDGVAGAGIGGGLKLWPHQTIPYVISQTYTPQYKAVILEAMMEISAKTCMVFKPWENEGDYIYIQNGDGCFASVGNQKGRQGVTLNADNCISKGTVIHELVHTIGFWHEQSRSDRDKYVRIIEENIIPDKLQQFQKYSSREVEDFDVPYDYSSIMHYGPQHFITDEALREGLFTILPKESGVEIGQRRNLSEKDALKIIRMNCPQREIIQPQIGATKSINEVTTENDNSCLGECRKGGKSYNWCYVSKESHGIKDFLVYKKNCEPKKEEITDLKSKAIDGVLSTHGIPCGSKCSRDEDTKY